MYIIVKQGDEEGETYAASDPDTGRALEFESINEAMKFQQRFFPDGEIEEYENFFDT